MKPYNMRHYMLLNKLETWARLAGNENVPVATNDLNLAAAALRGEVEMVKGYDSTVALVRPAEGLVKMYVDTRENNYRRIFMKVMESRAGVPTNDAAFHVDHVLSRGLAHGNFRFCLLEPVESEANTYWGNLEKAQKSRRQFGDPIMEKASIVEIAKMSAIAPVTYGNLAEDLLVWLVSGRESGEIPAKLIEPLVDSIRESENNVVRDSYEEVKSRFDALVRQEFKLSPKKSSSTESQAEQGGKQAKKD